MKMFSLVSAVAIAFASFCLIARAADPAPAETSASAPRLDAKQEAAIAANLAKLKPEDRKLAEAQKFCAIQTKNRLGTMGVPIKVMIKDQPVFLCCKGCQEKATANPEKTLASSAELVKANKKPEEKKAAESKS